MSKESRRKRILALHAQGCMTLQEIGDRVGVTAERIRQILQESDDAYDGRGRRIACTLKSRQREAVQDFESQERYQALRSFRAECRKRGIPFSAEMMKSGKGLYRNYVRVGSSLCVVRPCWVRARRDSLDYFRLGGVVGSLREMADFLVQSAGELGWFILPIEAAPYVMTTLVLGRDCLQDQRCKDWRQYLNRWDLIEGFRGRKA